MNFYTDTDEAATLAAMLATMGHVLHSTRTDGALIRAVQSVNGRMFIRCATLWQPGLDLAECHGGSGAKDAGVALAMLGDRGDQPVDFVICDDPESFAATIACCGIPLFRSDQMGEVLAVVSQNA